LQHAQANLDSKYRRNIYCQIDIGSSKVISSFFHSRSMAGQTADDSGEPKIRQAACRGCYTVWMNSNPATRFKRALTKADLTAIQERNADSPDVRALMWDVARLRALALRTHDYFRQGSSSTSLILADSLRAMFQAEPVILEQGTLP
jgi:hypothetical protein